MELLEKRKIENFKAKKLEKIKRKRREKNIETIKIILFFVAFSIYNYFILEYILDNLL